MKVKKRTVIFILAFLITLPLGILSAAPKKGTWETVTQFDVKHPCSLAGFLNETDGITVGRDGECYYTTDGGKTWPRAENATQWCLFSLEILDDKNAWYSGNGSKVGATGDAGKSWRLVHNFGGTVPNHCRYISFINSGTGWIASHKVLGTTIDGGENWTNINLPKQLNSISAIAGVSKEAVYLLDTSKMGGVLYFTSDGGQNWSVQPLGLKVELYPVMDTPCIVMRFFDRKQGTIVAKCKGGQIWEFDTADGGKTWSKIPVPSPKSSGGLFLSHDGRILTITGLDQVITILRKNS